jgi:ketopantoate reductase
LATIAIIGPGAIGATVAVSLAEGGIMRALGRAELDETDVNRGADDQKFRGILT